MFVTPGHSAEREVDRRRVFRLERLRRWPTQGAQRGERDRFGAAQTRPCRRGMDREAAKDAGMGQPMMTKGHENDLDVHCVETGQPGLGADEECLRLVGDTMKNRALRDRRRATAPRTKSLSAPSGTARWPSSRRCETESRAGGRNRARTCRPARPESRRDRRRCVRGRYAPPAIGSNRHRVRSWQRASLRILRDPIPHSVPE
jgi:hypothetical protein